MKNKDSEGECKIYKFSYNRDYRHRKIKLAYFGVFGILFLACICGTGKAVEKVLGMLFVLALSAAVYFCWRKFFRERWQFQRYVCERLKYFLEQNSLVRTHKETDAKGAITVIDYVPAIAFYRDSGKFTVAFKLDGSALSETFKDLGGRLGNLFNLNLESANEKQGFLYFVFPLGKDARLHIATSNEYRVCCKKDVIRITGRLSWNFRKVPHALITGGTGSGKTFFLTYLMGAFSYIGADIKIIDPKRSDISQFDKFVGSENVACEPNVIARLLREADEAMNARYEEFKQRKDNGFGKDYFDYGYQPTVIFFDEMTAFMGSADSKLAKEVNGYLMDIIMKGRQAGFFMVLTMQRPDAEYLKAAIRDNLGMRIALGRMSAEGYAMVFGNSGRDLQLKNYQKGDGFIYIDGKTSIPRQFSSPFIAGNMEKLFSKAGCENS